MDLSDKFMAALGCCALALAMLGVVYVSAVVSHSVYHRFAHGTACEHVTDQYERAMEARRLHAERMAEIENCKEVQNER